MQPAARSEWERQAILTFKVREVKRRLQQHAMDGYEQGQFRCEDQLADFMVSAGCYERAIVYYKEAMRFASSAEQRISALTSLAVTSSEMENASDAVK
ncbi:hypothetical protein PFISCL1PPCAC_3884 [Pristionchus fissidentatus]|uniref:Uncharacterized protein n=1 Tax=Pristionchus fissidentatus TaxID=1538716 RepID=A0AAV5V183_9BILA|nr:hypothetical protein PFISCL1PPCAC_3884 [Pristionchus fissidentatus]